MKHGLFLLAAGLLLAGPVPAQTTIELGADNRYERVTTLHSRIDGLDATEATRFQEKLLRIADMFAIMSWVHDPPHGLCARLSVSPQPRVWPPHGTIRPMATGSVGVLQPAEFKDGKCTDLTNNGVTVVINSFAGAFNSGEALTLDGQTFYAHPVIERQERGVTIFVDGSILVHRPGASIFRPVTKARYLEALATELQAAYADSGQVESGGEYARWLREEKPLLLEETAAQLEEMAGYMSKQELAELRRSLEEGIEAMDAAVRAVDAELAGMQDEADEAGAFQSLEVATVRQRLDALTPAERDLPACVTDDPLSAGPDQCPEGTMIVEFDPGFFADAGSAAEVRLIRISPGIGGLGRFRSESQPAYEQRIGIYRAIDLDVLRAMID